MKRALMILLAVVVASGMIGGVALAAPQDKTAPETTSKAQDKVTPGQVASDFAKSANKNKGLDPAADSPVATKQLPVKDKTLKMPEPKPGKEAAKSDEPAQSSDKFATQSTSTAASTQPTSSATTAPTYVFDWINNNSTLTHNDILYMAGASQTDINNYFSLYWGHKVSFRIFDSYAQWQAQAAKGWPVLIEPQADMKAICGQDAGGCHSVQSGTPISWVGQFDIPGTSWVANHEAKEMLEDPFITRVAQNGDHYYLAETVDPTQNYSAGYWVAAASGYPQEYMTDWTTTYFWVPGYPKPYNFRQTTPAQFKPDCTWPEKAGKVQFSVSPNTSGYGQTLTCV